MLTLLLALALAADPRVTAEQITLDYRENELRAETLYKGKVVEVTGKFKRLEVQESGAVLVYLAGEMLAKYVAACARDLRLATLRAGEKVTVTCTVRGPWNGEILGEACTLR